MQNEQEFTKQTRQGRELPKGNSVCKDTSVHGLTPFTGDPDPTGISPRFKALLNNQAKCKRNRNSFIGMSMLSPENFSTGCKHTIRFLECRRFSRPGHNQKLGPSLHHFVLSPKGTDRDETALSGKSVPVLIHSVKLSKPFIKCLWTPGIMSS